MNKKYCCTDLHGMWNLWEQIKNYCDDTDTIYFLGDAIDRGPYGIKIMKDLLMDKRVKYLLGNHEEFFIDVAPLLLNMDREDLLKKKNDFLNLWICNGGVDTIVDFVSCTNSEQNWLLNELKQLTDFTVYVNKRNDIIYLCHAGTDPSYTTYDLTMFEDNNPYTWDRNHIYRYWKDDFNNCYVAHGHTPVQYLWENKVTKPSGRKINGIVYPNIVKYADGHKFDLDLASYSSKTVALFDLDELEVVKYFEEEE